MNNDIISEKSKLITLFLLIFRRFRHPLTVPDMESFAAPNPYGFAGSYYGTPERYEMNRYAYRLGNRGSEEPEEPQAAALRVPSQEEAELQHVALEDEPVVFRRSGSYMTRSKFQFVRQTVMLIFLEIRIYFLFQKSPKKSVMNVAFSRNLRFVTIFC